MTMPSRIGTPCLWAATGEVVCAPHAATKSPADDPTKVGTSASDVAHTPDEVMHDYIVQYDAPVPSISHAPGVAPADAVPSGCPLRAAQPMPFDRYVMQQTGHKCGACGGAQ